jgi:hypothetical protein
VVDVPKTPPVAHLPKTPLVVVVAAATIVVVAALVTIVAAPEDMVVSAVPLTMLAVNAVLLVTVVNGVPLNSPLPHQRPTAAGAMLMRGVAATAVRMVAEVVAIVVIPPGSTNAVFMVT